MKRILVFLPIFFTGYFLNAQIQFDYIKPKKAAYKIGDLIELNIKIKTRPETCLKGMNRVKTYVSGLKIENIANWKELAKGFWQTSIQLRVVGNNRNSAKLTVMRRVDKEDLFKQEFFVLADL